MRTLSSNINNFDSPSPSPPTTLSRPPRRSITPGPRSPAPGTKLPIASPPRAPRLPKSPISPDTPSTPVVTTAVPTARPRLPSATSASAADSRPRLPPGYSDRHQHHVLSLTATTTHSTSLSAATISPKMPPGDTRHRPPQLSAAAAKNIGRTPITPKIASAKIPPTLTPLVRRSTQGQIPGQPYRDDLSTPAAGYRGGSRQSTPGGTPNPERNHDGWDPRATPAIEPSRQPSGQTDSSRDSTDSKFFYASDARSQPQPQPQPQPQQQQNPRPAQKPATFFYANGVSTQPQPKRTLSPPTNAPYLNPPITAQEPNNKFFYANGTPDAGSKSSLHSSAGSSTSRTTGRPTTSGSTTGGPRSMSPIKMLQQMPPSMKNMPSPGFNNRGPLASPASLAPTSAPAAKRRVSIETPRPPRSHARTGSIPSVDSSNSPKAPISPPYQHSEPSSPRPSSPSIAQPAMTMASMLQMVEDLPEDDESRDGESNVEVQSPTKSTHGLEGVSELVANARRERKVQDLEITNASLEAINRTLERQLRKQTTELRRYRRLSRSGRISSLTSAASSRVPSAALTNIPISLTDLSEEEDEEHGEDFGFSDDDHDSMDESDFSSGDLTSSGELADNPEATEKAIVRRKRDEKRLQLDLTKHRELLVDSQKMNQSIKRCLNWTEVLIKEGQKALEYKVRVSDVDFGGHVLAPPDEEDEQTRAADAQLLSKLDLDLDPPSQTSQREKNPQDRDSGIELHPDSS